MTNYYVDGHASTNGNGTFHSPWNNIPSVNNFSFNTADCVYFKTGTTTYLNSDTQRLQIDWSGGSNIDRAVIGAYYGENLFGLGGQERPIIDGRNLYPGTEQEIVSAKNRSFVTIKDLRLQNSGGIVNNVSRRGRAIGVYDSINVNVDNCYMYRTHGCTMVYMRVNTGQITNNFSQNSKYPDYPNGGAAVEISAGNIDGGTTNILISRNKVFEGAHEGIGLYKNCTYCIVEHNTVRDIQSFHLYNGASKYNIWRYNLAYNSTVQNYKNSWGPKYALASDVEDWKTGERFHGGCSWYGNFVAGMDRGIHLGCGLNQYEPECLCYVDTEKVYGNTFVDCNLSISYTRPNVLYNVDIRNNISWIVTEGIGSRHAIAYSPDGATWSHNLYYGGPAVTGNAATNMRTGNPQLQKQSGWRNIAPDSITINDFRILSNSDALNTGVAVS